MVQMATHGLGPRKRLALALALVMGLTACEDGANFSFLKPGSSSSDASASRSTTLVERDVEAPEVFSASEAGLWDGRPSLGGVWVAHPDALDPERVIIRNQANGKFVIGALFRREREIPGPRLQVSSDAAAALGMLAGQPVELEVTALVRETVEDTPIEPAPLDAPDVVEEEALDPVAAATAAIEDIEGASPEPEPAAPAPVSSLDKPYVQIGIFSVESNAKGAAAQMRSAGMVPEIRQSTIKGKTFWRVLVGPASSKSERASLIKAIHGTGFTDAYAVSK